MRSGWWVESVEGLGWPNLRALLLGGILLLVPGSFFVQAGVLDEYRLHRAQVLQKEGKYKEALELYRMLPASSEEIRYNMGNLYYRLGRYDDALRLYRGVESPALQGRRLYNMGNCYARKGDWRKAERFYRAAMKFAPDDPRLRYNLKRARGQLRRMALEDSLMKLKKSRRKKVCKLERFPLGVRRGIYEGKIDFGNDFEGNDTLEEAKFGSVLVKRSNVARSVGERGEGAAMETEEKERNRSVIRGDENVMSLARERYERALRERELKSLLVPLEKKKEMDDAPAH